MPWVRCAWFMTDLGMTPAERTLRAKIAAHKSWAATPNRAARTEAARKASYDRFEKIVDPEGVLPPHVRRQLADSERRAHFVKMALRSAQSKRAKSTGKNKKTA